MKTIEINTYKISELSEDAKRNAIDTWRQGEDFSYLVDEASISLKKFCELFSIDLRDFDFCEHYRSRYSFDLEDNILELTGQRLATYIWNNYRTFIYCRKYFGSFVRAIYPQHKRIKPSKLNSGDNKGQFFCAYHSAIMLEESCPFTGVCYDADLLQPIFDFMRKPTHEDFKDVLEDCLHSLAKSVCSEIAANSTDEAIIETMEANDYDFDEDGEMI